MNEQRLRANHYAQAILEAMMDQWQSTLNQVTEALAQNPGVRSTLESASQDMDTKMEALQRIIPQGTPQEIQNFLKQMVQDDQLNLIPRVVSELRMGITGRSEPNKAEIISAVPLKEEEQAELRSRLIAEHGEGLVFSFRVDPSLLGGLRVRVGDTLVDNTIASRLTAMREIVSASVR
jgi:F-type H+-transporting ATPase subunit delta